MTNHNVVPATSTIPSKSNSCGFKG